METIFNCKIVTPMFLGGADNSLHAAPELRPPSIRGAMRWWFRAMMGGIICNNIEGLRKLETLVFGDSEISSSISIKKKSEKLEPKEYARRPNKTGTQALTKNAIDNNQSLEIIITLNPWVKENKNEIFSAAVESLKLLLTFGGLGNRSRRGFGSLYWNNDKSEKTILEEARKNFIDFCEKLGYPESPCTNIPSFPCIAKGYFDVWISEESNNWETHLINLMNEMSSFKLSENRNAIGDIIPSRQASPLIVHTKKDSDNNFKLVFSHFRTKLSSNFHIDNNNRNALERVLEENLNAKRIGVFI